MKTREEALNYGLSFPNTYMEMPFHDPNWQLVRVKGSKKVFLWTYEKDGCLHLNVKTDPAWRDFWRSTFSSVIPAYHQNKDHWNTIILDGSIPDEDIRRMIAESYDLVTDSPTKRIYEEKDSERLRRHLRSGCRHGRRTEDGPGRGQCPAQEPGSRPYPLLPRGQFQRGTLRCLCLRRFRRTGQPPPGRRHRGHRQ